MPQKKANPKIEWGFFAVVPRVVRTQYKDLTHADKWLYTCLKDLCGDKGTCFRTLRSLKEETDISIASLSTMIPKLHEAGLIHAEKKRRSISGKEVWHITIVDIWQSNKEYCSKNEQSRDEIVQNLNNVVQQLNKEAEVCSAIERDCSNFSDRRTTPEEQHIEERTREEESIVVSAIAENDAPADNVHDIEAMRKRKTDPQLPAVKGNTHDLLDTPGNSSASNPGGIREDVHRSGGGDTTLVNDTLYHIANTTGYEKDEETPTEKRAAVKIGANHDPHPRDSNGLLDIPGQRVPDLGIAGADRQVRRSAQEEIALQQTPAASVSLSLAVAPRGGQDDTGGRQAIRSPVSLSTLVPAVSSGASLTGNPPASPEARQGRQVIPKRPRGKVTQESAEPMPKSDTREIQRRINEHRGYMLEEKVDIVRERQAIKTWCNLHTIEEYGLVMAGAKNDKYWGKQENYYRIGGLMLLKITPEILARQRAPLQIASNGNGHHSDMVEWQGQWMTVAEADECGFNGGFGLYK